MYKGLKITTVDALAKYRSAQASPIAEVDAPTKTETPDSTSTRTTDVELLAECEVPIARGDKYLGMWTLRYAARNSVIECGLP